MKNYLSSIPFISLIFAIFYLSDAVDSKPVSTSDFLAGSNSAQVVEISLDAFQTPVNKRFSWQPVKTTAIPFGKSLTLTSPYILTSAPTGDISWVADGKGYVALQPTKVQFVKLGKIDINSITTTYLNTLKFNSDMVPASPSAANPNELAPNTVVACKTTDGQYFLLEIVRVNWGMYWDVQLSVYQATYDIINV